MKLLKRILCVTVAAAFAAAAVNVGFGVQTVLGGVPDGYTLADKVAFSDSDGKLAHSRILANTNSDCVKEKDLGLDDDWSLRRKSSNGSIDGTVDFRVADDMRIYLRVLLYEAFDSDVKLQLQTRASDGDSWVNSASSRELKGVFDTANNGNIYDYSAAALPTGTTQLRLVYGSVSGDSDSSWYPIVDSVEFYRPEGAGSEPDAFDFSGFDLRHSLNFSNESGGQGIGTSARIVSSENVQNGYLGGALPAALKWGLQRNNNVGADGTLVLSVADNMVFDIREMRHTASNSIIVINYETSPDGVNFTAVDSAVMARKTDPVNTLSDFTIEKVAIGALPAGTQFLRITIGTTDRNPDNWWLSVVNTVDFYTPKKPESMDLSGYVKKERLGFTDKGDGLSNERVHSYRNLLNSATEDLAYTDDRGWMVQRPFNSAEPGIFTLHVDDAMVFELCPIFHNASAVYAEIKIETSPDNAAFTALADEKLYVRKVIDSGLGGYTPEIWTVTQLPAGTKYLRITLDTTIHTPDMWWMPIMDYVDIYVPLNYVDPPPPPDRVPYDFSGLESLKRLSFTDKGDGLSDPLVESYVGIHTTALEAPTIDAQNDPRGFCLQRPFGSTEDGSVVFNITDKMTIDVFTMQHFESIPKIKFEFLTSADGATYAPFTGIELRKLSENAQQNFIYYQYVLKSLPEGVKYLKVVMGCSISEFWWTPLIDYVEFYVPSGYKPPVSEDRKPYDFSGLKLYKHLGFTDKGDGLPDQITYDYGNIQGMALGFPTVDKANDPRGFCLQRPKDSSADGSVVFRAHELMTVDVFTMQHFDSVKKIKFEFFWSADGKSFMPIDAKNIELRKISDNAQANFIFYQYVLKSFPKGTKFFKIVMGYTGNDKEFWWTPLIDYVDFYLPKSFSGDPLGNLDEGGISPYDGYKLQYHIGFTDKGDNLTEKIVNSYEGVQSAAVELPYTDDRGWYMQRVGNSGKEGCVIFDVIDYMQIEICEMLFSSALKQIKVTYSVSPDGEMWETVPESVMEKLIARTGAPVNFTPIKRKISELPKDTKFFKISIFAEGGSDMWWTPLIDYVDFYVPDMYYISPEDMLKFDSGNITYLRLLNPADKSYIFITGDVITIDLNNSAMRVSELLSKLDPTRYTMAVFNKKEQLNDLSQYLKSGMVLKLMDLGEPAKEFSIVLLNEGMPPADTAAAAPVKPFNPVTVLYITGGLVILIIGAAAFTLVKTGKRTMQPA